MNSRLVALARASVAILFVGTLGIELLVPLQAQAVAGEFPEVRDLVLPYSVAGVLAFIFVQVALVAVWALLGRMKRDAFFTTASLRWIDLIRASVTCAAALPSAVAIHLLAFRHVGGPGVILGLVAVVAAGVALVLMLTVARNLFLSAKADRDELAAVI